MKCQQPLENLRDLANIVTRLKSSDQSITGLKNDINKTAEEIISVRKEIILEQEKQKVKVKDEKQNVTDDKKEEFGSLMSEIENPEAVVKEKMSLEKNVVDLIKSFVTAYEKDYSDTDKYDPYAKTLFDTIKHYAGLDEEMKGENTTNVENLTSSIDTLIGILKDDDKKNKQSSSQHTLFSEKDKNETNKQIQKLENIASKLEDYPSPLPRSNRP